MGYFSGEKENGRTKTSIEGRYAYKIDTWEDGKGKVSTQKTERGERERKFERNWGIELKQVEIIDNKSLD